MTLNQSKLNTDLENKFTSIESELRLEKPLSIRARADFIGIKHTVLFKTSKGNNMPDLVTMVKICNFLGTQMNDYIIQ